MDTEPPLQNTNLICTWKDTNSSNKKGKEAIKYGFFLLKKKTVEKKVCLY